MICPHVVSKLRSRGPAENFTAPKSQTVPRVVVSRTIEKKSFNIKGLWLAEGEEFEPAIRLDKKAL